MNQNNYCLRSLAEVMIFRFKRLSGANVMVRTVERQEKEIGIRCII
jgi:hypothetical protein